MPKSGNPAQKIMLPELQTLHQSWNRFRGCKRKTRSTDGATFFMDSLSTLAKTTPLTFQLLLLLLFAVSQEATDFH
jgi:hypothetical protein